MGVSGEGFTLCYNMLDFLQEGKWNNQSLDDCFAAEGIKYRLFGDGTIPVKDTPMNPGTVGEQDCTAFAFGPSGDPFSGKSKL